MMLDIIGKRMLVIVSHGTRFVRSNGNLLSESMLELTTETNIIDSGHFIAEVGREMKCQMMDVRELINY